MSQDCGVGECLIQDRPRLFLVTALRATVGFHDKPAGDLFSELSKAETERIAEIAMRNKVGGLIRNGALRAGVNLDIGLDDMLKAQQSQTVAKNLRNLIETEQVCDILRDANIDFIVLKGPLRSFDAFGGIDSRISNDIDVIVKSDEYFRAGEVLCNSGYRRGVSSTDRWWHDHLGESPFFPKGGQCVVDVHHKVQQPGGPSPSRLGEFFESAIDIRVANRNFRVLNPHHALLLSYISASKALRSEEFWLGYAAEIAINRNRMTGNVLNEFKGIARHQGLSRLVSHIDLVVDQVFAFPFFKQKSPKHYYQHADLAAFTFKNGMSLKRRLHRSRLLWAWAEGRGAVRAARFVRLAADLMIADLRRSRDGDA